MGKWRHHPFVADVLLLRRADSAIDAFAGMVLRVGGAVTVVAAAWRATIYAFSGLDPVTQYLAATGLGLMATGALLRGFGFARGRWERWWGLPVSVTTAPTWPKLFVQVQNNRSSDRFRVKTIDRIGHVLPWLGSDDEYKDIPGSGGKDEVLIGEYEIRKGTEEGSPPDVIIQLPVDDLPQKVPITDEGNCYSAKWSKGISVDSWTQEAHAEATVILEVIVYKDGADAATMTVKQEGATKPHRSSYHHSRIPTIRSTARFFAPSITQLDPHNEADDD